MVQQLKPCLAKRSQSGANADKQREKKHNPIPDRWKPKAEEWSFLRENRATLVSAREVKPGDHWQGHQEKTFSAKYRVLQRSSQCSGHFYPWLLQHPDAVPCLPCPDSITLLVLRPVRISPGWPVILFQGNNLFSAMNCHGYISTLEVQVLANFALCTVCHTLSHWCDHHFSTLSLPLPPFFVPKNWGACTFLQSPLQTPTGVSSQRHAMSVGLTVSSFTQICPQKAGGGGQKLGTM